MWLYLMDKNAFFSFPPTREQTWQTSAQSCCFTEICWKSRQETFRNGSFSSLTTFWFTAKGSPGEKSAVSAAACQSRENRQSFRPSYWLSSGGRGPVESSCFSSEQDKPKHLDASAWGRLGSVWLWQLCRLPFKGLWKEVNQKDQVHQRASLCVQRSDQHGGDGGGKCGGWDRFVFALQPLLWRVSVAESVKPWDWAGTAVFCFNGCWRDVN